MFGKKKLGSIFDRPALSASLAAGNSSKAIVSGGANGICGAEVRESTGSAATAWRLRDGTVTGTILCVLGAPSGSTASAYFPPQGVQVLTGIIFAENVSGSGELVVWYG